MVCPMRAIALRRSLFRRGRADRYDQPLVIILVSERDVEFAQLALAVNLNSPLPLMRHSTSVLDFSSCSFQPGHYLR